jgi:hypothetical protein
MATSDLQNSLEKEGSYFVNNKLIFPMHNATTRILYDSRDDISIISYMYANLYQELFCNSYTNRIAFIYEPIADIFYEKHKNIKKSDLRNNINMKFNKVRFLSNTQILLMIDKIDDYDYNTIERGNDIITLNSNSTTYKEKIEIVIKVLFLFSKSKDKTMFQNYFTDNCVTVAIGLTDEYHDPFIKTLNNNGFCTRMLDLPKNP